MIEETALVLEVKGQHVLLETQRKSACQSCSVKSGCGTSTCQKLWVNVVPSLLLIKRWM